MAIAKIDRAFLNEKIRAIILTPIPRAHQYAASPLQFTAPANAITEDEEIFAWEHIAEKIIDAVSEEIARCVMEVINKREGL